MRKFLIRTAIFILIVISILSATLLLPVTPRASQSHFYSILLKDSLLANVDSPRMIFIGGSNISFGLNSQMIKDSLNVTPINTGISVDLGLKFMLNNTAQYVKKGDVIIAPLEYKCLTKEYSYCDMSLLRIVLDVDKKYLRLLNFQQVLTLCPAVISYSMSKLNPGAYFNVKVDHLVYHRNSFNRYGDNYAHWGMENRIIRQSVRLDDFNPQIIDRIKDFEKIVEEKGARLYLTYPSYLDASFHKSEDIIATIRAELEKNFTVLGTPERYMMPDSLMFDTSYHTNKKGADVRTARLIEDIKKLKRCE